MKKNEVQILKKMDLYKIHGGTSSTTGGPPLPPSPGGPIRGLRPLDSSTSTTDNHFDENR